MHDVALTYSLASNYIGYQCRYLRIDGCFKKGNNNYYYIII